MKELELKLGRIRDLLDRHSLDGLLLRGVDNFAWATCGAASYVNTAASLGAASVLIVPEGRYIITDNIEAARLEQEEHLGEQGWEFQISHWYEESRAVTDLSRGLKLGADGFYPGAVDLTSALSHSRAALLPEEGARFRKLAKCCAEAMDVAIRGTRPGVSEYQIAGLLAREALSRGVQPTVNLVATDERVFHYRHPLPTGKLLNKYAMLVLCGRNWGLVCSITRLVHFGAVPQDLRRKGDAVAQIDAELIAATRPGQRLNDVLAKGIEAYRAAGFPDEWKLHHQGGLAGYAPREIVATPTTTDEVLAGQAYAWNPSISGAKSEDTILVGPEGNEILTAMSDWPTIRLTVDGLTIDRPAVLEIT